MNENQEQVFIEQPAYFGGILRTQMQFVKEIVDLIMNFPDTTLIDVRTSIGKIWIRSEKSRLNLTPLDLDSIVKGVANGILDAVEPITLAVTVYTKLAHVKAIKDTLNSVNDDTKLVYKRNDTKKLYIDIEQSQSDAVQIDKEGNIE